MFTCKIKLAYKVYKRLLCQESAFIVLLVDIVIWFGEDCQQMWCRWFMQQRTLSTHLLNKLSWRFRGNYGISIFVTCVLYPQPKWHMSQIWKSHNFNLTWVLQLGVFVFNAIFKHLSCSSYSNWFVHTAGKMSKMLENQSTKVLVYSLACHQNQIVTSSTNLFVVLNMSQWFVLIFSMPDDSWWLSTQQ